MAVAGGVVKEVEGSFDRIGSFHFRYDRSYTSFLWSLYSINELQKADEVHPLAFSYGWVLQKMEIAQVKVEVGFACVNAFAKGLEEGVGQLPHFR